MQVNRVFDELDPPVPVDPVGHTHRVLITANQKKEQVGDGDRKFCHRFDSIEAKTGRIVQHYGLADARRAAPALLGHLTTSVNTSSKLPPIPASMKHDSQAIGVWAAKLISLRPAEQGTWETRVVARQDFRRPKLGMREVCRSRGSEFMAPTAFKQPRRDAIAARLPIPNSIKSPSHQKPTHINTKTATYKAHRL